MHAFDREPELFADLCALALIAAIFGLAFLQGRYWPHVRWCLSPVTKERGKSPTSMQRPSTLMIAALIPCG